MTPSVLDKTNPRNLWLAAKEIFHTSLALDLVLHHTILTLKTDRMVTTLLLMSWRAMNKYFFQAGDAHQAS